jgi:hypothetical protein
MDRYTNLIASGRSRTARPSSPARPTRALLAAGSALLLAASASAAGLQAVATGLNNPRGLDFAPNGALFIAEAGTGGGSTGTRVTGPEGELSFGLTGSVTRVFRGVQERIVTGLPSLAAEDGSGAIGPSAVAFGQLGHGYLAVGLGLEPELRASPLGPLAAPLGTLHQLTMNGQLRLLADLAAFEEHHDPDGLGPDSNPNGVAAGPRGGVYVADAGANALLYVSASGSISVVAVFPNRTVATPPALPQPPFPAQLSMQSVPTNVVVGADGAVYVSELTGFPFPPGEARIYRVVPGSAPTVYASGFTHIIDLEFDRHGNLYVLEINASGLLSGSPAGRLARINAGDGTVQTIVAEGLIMPGGMAIGPDGAIYISNFSVVPGGGEVVRVVP